MKTPDGLSHVNGLNRGYLLGILLAVAAVAVAVAVVLRPGDGAAPATADNSASPAPAGYIKFDGVDGESVDREHKDWIDILSVSQGITRPMSAGISGSTRQRSTATFQDIVVVKEIDKSTPKLQEAIAQGKVFPTLKLDLTSPQASGSSQPYLQWELKNVIVTNYRISGGVSGDERPTETITLNFEEIKVTYSSISPDGSSSGNVEYSWKVEEGTS